MTLPGGAERRGRGIDPRTDASARHTTVHDGVPDAVRDALLGWLPQSEAAVSMRGAVTVTVEVADGGVPVAAALVVEDRPTLSGAALAVACAGEAGAAEQLAARIAPLARRAGQLEVVGPAALARPLAAGIAEGVAGTLEVVMEQRLMVAASVEEPRDVVGRARRVQAGDRLLVARWLDAFAVEALATEPRGTEHWLEHLDDPAWQLWLWEVEGRPVSLVNGRPTTPVSSRIGPVYTPPEHRSNGYGGALTAHVTAVRLAAGDERVTLFTDVTNATSNELYVRIGYVDLTAHGSWLVTVAAGGSDGADGGDDH